MKPLAPQVFDLCESVQICRFLQIFTNLYRSKQGPVNYYKVFRVTRNYQNYSNKYVAEILQQQHFINTSTNPEGCHMSNFIRQNKVKKANELLKVQQPLLESSSEIDKLRCFTNTAHSPVTKTTVMGTNFPSREL